MNDDLSFNSTNNSSESVDLSFLQKNQLLDTTYAPHRNSNNEWKFGDSDIKISKEKLLYEIKIGHLQLDWLSYYYESIYR